MIFSVWSLRDEFGLLYAEYHIFWMRCPTITVVCATLWHSNESIDNNMKI